jgi:nucleoside-diphosphate-sugar epimerase
MAILVTGASGFIGSRLCLSLAKQGQQVVAFCRKHPGDDSELQRPGIRIALGDIRDSDSVLAAMKDCTSCFHLAGIAKQWSRNRNDFYEINVGGTINILQSASQCGLSRIVHTSSAGIFGPSASDIIDEESVIPTRLGTIYEQTKLLADQQVLKYARGGLNAVIVNPTRTFGPGPLTESNSVTRIMIEYARGNWRVIPGNGRSLGNYVFVGDVVDGIQRAMKSGHAGRRYILGGENLSFNQLLDIVQRNALDGKNVVHIPRSVVMVYASMQIAKARFFGISPKLTPDFARRYFSDYVVSSKRAERELGYNPAPLEQRVQETLKWVNEPI